MIKLQTLTEADKGKTVYYVDGLGEVEDGILKSWNDVNIFVVYPGKNMAKREHWDRYTAAATAPEDLFWNEDDIPCDHQESEMGSCVACGESTVEDRSY